MGWFGRIVIDDERCHIHLCRQKRSAKEGSPKLEDPRAEYVGDEFSHFNNLCELLTVVGESKGRNKCTQM